MRRPLLALETADQPTALFEEIAAWYTISGDKPCMRIQHSKLVVQAIAFSSQGAYDEGSTGDEGDDGDLYEDD